MPFAVNSITGVIIAVGKHIIAENSLSCTHQRIGIDKPTNCGVVVPTLEIVQIRLGIVDVSSIGQGIHRAQSIRHGAGNTQNFTPGVVGVLYLYIAVGIDDRYHIALEVSDVVINIIAVCYRTIAEIKGFSGGLQVL